LFLAVTPPPDVRDDLHRALAGLRGMPGAPRWTAPERWHLTLVFLGAVPVDRVPALRAAAGSAVAPAPAVTVRVTGGGHFGSRRRPRVAWAGLAGDIEALTALAGALAAAARSVGLTVEDRPFRPHLTLGRWPPGAPADGGLLDRLAGYRGPEWPVREVTLVRSRLGPDPRYEPIAAWPVG
jgi:2'-5' RNA ligase